MRDDHEKEREGGREGKRLREEESKSHRESQYSDRAAGGSKQKQQKSRGEEDKVSKEGYNEEKETPWLVPNIRIKVIDKRLDGGRYYLKKGVVVDVKAPTVCDVFLDGTNESVLVSFISWVE